MVPRNLTLTKNTIPNTIKEFVDYKDSWDVGNINNSTRANINIFFFEDDFIENTF